MSDNWDFYFCTVEDCPASIFLDLGIRAEIPDEGLPDLVWFSITMKAPRDDGLSSQDEYDALVEIEETLVEAVSGFVEPVAFVGRNTSDGTREFFFYSKNGSSTRDQLSRILQTGSDYAFTSGQRNDPGWSCYLDFLYPSERDLQLIQSGRVLRGLESRGGPVTERRLVTHWVYFSSPADPREFSKACVRNGFTVRSEETGGEDTLCLCLERLDSLQALEMNEVVLELYDLAVQMGGRYDGWEAQLGKG